VSSGDLPAPRCWNCRPDLTGSRLLTISEAARSCGVSINAVYQWMERGLIDWVLTPGGMRRIFSDTLTRLQQKRRERQR
jgi:predicted site-specific integrase-resolvase